MSDNRGANFLSAFLAGAALGAGGALLFAPRSGEETRDKLKQWGQQARESVETRSRDITERIRHLRTDIEDLTSRTLETGQERLTGELEALRAALDQGIRVLREEREKRSRARTGAHETDEDEFFGAEGIPEESPEEL